MTRTTLPTVRPAHRTVGTPLGTYTLAARDGSLTGVWREGQAHAPGPVLLGPPDEDPSVEGGDRRLLALAEEQLLAYLAGERTAFSLPLAPTGTPFQHEVWAQLRTVPRGSTTTYGEIARAVGRPRGSQAVGGAVGRNPLSIVVPCHRVVASDGRITGYAGGIETKRSLLLLEGAPTA